MEEQDGLITACRMEDESKDQRPAKGMADTKALQDTRFNAPKTLACLHQPAKKRSRQRCLHLFFISRLVLGCTQRHARRAMSGLSHDQPRSTSAVEEEDWAGGGGGAGGGEENEIR